MSEATRIIPMTQELAEEIAAWEYPGEYAVYNREQDAALDDLLDGSSYAVRNIAGDLVGFYQFGKEARVPAEEGAYPDGPLDMGLGLRPDLCGLRLGQPFAEAGMKFAREELGAGSCGSLWRNSTSGPGRSTAAAAFSAFAGWSTQPRETATW